MKGIKLEPKKPADENFGLKNSKVKISFD